MTDTPASMSSFAAMLPSGIDPVDEEWGGLYRGGAYLAFGRAATGRGLMTLRFAQTGVQGGEHCLFIASDRPRDLVIQAASIGFDLKQSQQDGLVRLMRIPPMMNPQAMGDDSVAKALWDLVTIIRKQRPERLVINDFMPFVMFRSFDRFRMEFIRMLEQIDSLETTVVVALPEPANPQSRRVIDFMAGQMTGAIHIEAADEEPTSTERRLTLIPHIGQIKRQVVRHWDLAEVVTAPGQGTLITEERAETQARPAPNAPRFPHASPEIGVSAPERTAEEEDAIDRYSDRGAFQTRLEKFFQGREDGASPFLLLAMRMDQTSDRGPVDFDFIIDLVADSLRPQDDMLISAFNERLVVLLAESKPEEAQGFFARLKNRLRADAPKQADHLLHAVSAIVVPDGRPFQSADEFLIYAMDEA
ncbi:MAG: KaiC/GvpD/RAD55 family RecA-like ATPase [Rhodothermales bacterium]|jgi:KaiC/GvpD/RAD55 family RecA-like ATPase